MSKEKISKVLKIEFKSGFSIILYKQPVVSSVSTSFKHIANLETLFLTLSIFFLSTFSTFDVFLFDQFYAYRWMMLYIHIYIYTWPYAFIFIEDRQKERKEIDRWFKERERENEISKLFLLVNLFLKIFAGGSGIPPRENLIFLFSFLSSFRWRNFCQLCTNLKISSQLIWSWWSFSGTDMIFYWLNICHMELRSAVSIMHQSPRGYAVPFWRNAIVKSWW